MSEYRFPDGTVPLLVSSDSARLLPAEASALLAFVSARDDLGPSEVAAMVFRVRAPRRHRALARVVDRTGMLDALAAIADGVAHPAVTTTGPPAGARRLAYVFPGQGSQRPGMGALYHRMSQAFRAEADRCDAIFHELFGESPLWFLLHEGDESDPRIGDVRTVQPALFVQMVSLAAMWRAVGVEPSVTVGHSQGEIAAAYFSGVLSLADAIRVVTVRAQLVHENAPQGHSMAVLGIDRDECEALLARESGFAELSVVNSSHILCISGERHTVVAFVEKLTAAGKFAREIRVEYPAHTSIVSQFRTEFTIGIAQRVAADSFASTTVPCIGATLGAEITPEFPIGDYWFWNLRNRVRFDRAIAAAVDLGVDTFVEMAENPTLLLAMNETLSERDSVRDNPSQTPRVVGTSRRAAEDLAEFTDNVARVAVDDLHYRWDALIQGEPRITAPLRDFPSVQMAQTPFWASSATRLTPSSGIPDGERAEEVPAATPQRLIESWTRLDRRTLAPPRTIAVIDHTGRCGDLADAMCGAARRHGASATVVCAQTPPPSAVDTLVVLVPESSNGDGIEDDPVTAVAELADFFGRRAWLDAAELIGIDADRPLDTWLVTVGGESIGRTDTGAGSALFAPAVAAGFRCIATERVGIRPRHLDLPAGQGTELARAAITAIHTVDEPELALRADGLYAKRLVVDADAVPTAIDAACLDSVVIIGGTGRIGLEFCEHLVDRGARRITLISRSGADDAVARRIDSIRARSSAEIVVTRCDVTDETAVGVLADAHRDRPVGLLVHTAVEHVEAELRDIDPELIISAADAKVVGVATVLRLLPLAENAAVVLCSSIAATLGGRGQIVYAATNRMLDRMSNRLRRDGIRATTLQWGLWSTVGVVDANGVARVAATGVSPMIPRAAIETGVELRSPAADDAVVIAAQWSTLRTTLGPYGYRPLLGELLDQTPIAPDHVDEPRVADDIVDPPVPAATRDIADQVRRELGSVIGVRDIGDMDATVPLVALGLDSMQALDFQSRIRSTMARDLPVDAILGGASLDEVVSLMAAPGLHNHRPDDQLRTAPA